MRGPMRNDFQGNDGAFSSLPNAIRERMRAMAPRWAEDIVGNRKQVLAAYEPVLAARPLDGIEIERDIRYGSHERHRLDVYRKPSARNAAIVAFVHGGAFVRGDKDVTPHIYGNVPRYFARHGCVGINIEYRLASEAQYPAGAQDVDSAIAWIHASAMHHGGDAQRIVLVGHSAGAAHAAAYVGDPAGRTSDSHGVAALALISGRLRADVRPDNPNADAVRAYYGDDPALYEARSVVTHAANFGLPMFLAIAEFENPYLDVYMAEFAARVGIRQRRVPRFLQLLGQNHTSMVAHFDAGEELLDRAILEFVQEVT